MDNIIGDNNSLSMKVVSSEKEKIFQKWLLKRTNMPSFFEKCRHKISYFAWRRYRHLASLYGRNSLGIRENSKFLENEIKLGCLSPKDLKLLKSCVEKSPTISRKAKDCIAGYFSDPDAEILDGAWADHFRFFDLSSSEEDLRTVFSSIASEISECFGHPFCIVNTNSWAIMPSSAGMASNAWHNDGFPPGIYKLIIYINPVDKNNGSTEIKMSDGSSMIIEGPPGTWLLFNSTALVHRGLPANAGERIIVNLIIAPAFKENPLPIFAGISANFPWFPWSIPKSNS